METNAQISFAETSVEMTNPELRINGVSHFFATPNGFLEVLHDLDLEVAKGEFLCIVGSSGCGKSTLLNIVAGFIQPIQGRIFLRDEEVLNVDPRIGLIFQSYALFPWKTVVDNVEFGLKMKHVAPSERRKVAEKYLALVNLNGCELMYPDELSGGMCQRVALARALANDPEILLMDEPFAAVDAMTRQSLQEQTLSIVQATHKTIIFVTHSLDEALILSDRIVVMSARPGRVKAMVKNTLPRPRRVDIQLSDEYLESKRRIWSLVEKG